MHSTAIIGCVVVLCMSAGVSPAVQAFDAPDQQQAAIGQTPLRLSFLDGQVSFRRPGARDWTQAQLNTPLAPGDRLYTGSSGNLELQIGSRAFVRAGTNTQIGLQSREPDFLQFEVTTGYASFDLRGLEPGRRVEVDTPNAAFTIDHAGYYRVDVNSEQTAFITRRGGRASVALGNGDALAIAPGEAAGIKGTASPKVTFYGPAQLDEWDRWNYDRTDHLEQTVSARYVSPGVYAGDLDFHGRWRIVPTYGPVWVPTAVPSGWVPYSTGTWILDPYYGWTWLDTAPWGWAPYHYGRWVFVDGFWGWAPGPVVARPVYAPALVAFFDGPGVCWVALGWGEPVVPWWGPRSFIHRPWWGGWGGPRIVNNVVIKKTTVVNVKNITVYRNADVHNALVAVDRNHFGRYPIASARMPKVDARRIRPIHIAPRIDGTPARFNPDTSRGRRPPEWIPKRPLITAPPQHAAVERILTEKPNIGQVEGSRPPYLVGGPKQQKVGPAQAHPSFQKNADKRPRGDRAYRSALPRLKSPSRTNKVSEAGPPAPRRIPPQSRRKLQVSGQSMTVPQPQARRPEGLQPQQRRLSGGPVNQLSPAWVKGSKEPGASLKAALKNRSQKRVESGRP